jgi:putative DNA-invertase from lambdoid prophage Rac
MTIYSYCRKSELEATYGGTKLEEILEPEMLAIQTYCLSEQWYMTETLRDEDCNWNLEFHKRLNGKRLMSMLRPGDVVLCSKLERIVSSGSEAVELINRLRERSVKLHVVDLGGDISSSEFSVNFERAASMFAALERRKSAERIK